MSTIIIITRPPTVVNRSVVSDTSFTDAMEKLNTAVDELRALGCDVEVQRPEV